MEDTVTPEEGVETLSQDSNAPTEKAEEVETSPSEDVGIGDSDEISADDLGIDLDSLVLPDKSVLGKQRRGAELRTDSNNPVGRPKKDEEALFEWCENFNYAPGIDYLSLERLHPKIWEGITIGGFIEHLYEPIDEHWIAGRWGGGSYQLKAHQRDSTGRNRIVQQKFVEISGLPKAFLGEDGIPRPLPAAGRGTSHRSEDVLKRRAGLGRHFFGERNFSEDVDRERETDRRSNVDQPLVNATSLYKIQQESKKAESDALSVLRDAQKDVQEQMQRTSAQQQEMYRTMLESQKEEIARIREEQRAASQESSAPFKDFLQYLMTKSDQGSGASRQHLEELRRMHDARISGLTDELNRTRMEYTTQVERIRGDYLEKEKSSKDDAFRFYQAQIEAMRTQESSQRESYRDQLHALQTSVSELRAEIVRKDSDHRATILERETALRAEYSQREQGLKDDFRNQVDALQRKLDKMELGSRQDRSDLEAKYRAEFQERYEERVRLLEESYTTRLETLRENFEGKAQLAKEREEILQKEGERDRENQKLIIETRTSTEKLLVEAEKARLEDRLREADAQIRKLEKESSSGGTLASDPFAQLEQLNQIKDKLRAHGFISEDEDSPDEEEKAPKDFLGKVVHYGPQLLAPILQRVDQATALAREAMNQQGQSSTAQQQQAMLEHQQALLRSREEEFQRQQLIEARRQDAIQRQEQLRARREMLIARRQERIEPPSSEDVVEVVQLNEEETMPSPPPTPEVFEEGTQMSTRDEAFKKLADFLGEGIAKKKTSSAMIRELKMAEMMGMFSAEAKQAILSEDFEKLHSELVQHNERLKTPRGRKTALEVYRGLK